MIRFAPDNILMFANFLNSQYPTRIDVLVTMLHGYDTVDAGGGNGFAIYIPDQDRPTIMIAGDVPEGVESADFVLENLAHEYCHHIQFCESRLPIEESELTEEEAEQFSKIVVKEYSGKQFL